MSDGLTEALDRGYRDWTYGDPLRKIDLSALDAIIEAATEHERCADFPSDEDVEVAYQSLYESSERFTPAPWKVERALQAVADARRTEEEGM